MSTIYDGTFKVTSPYGYRTDPISGAKQSWHGGIDVVGVTSKNVRAVASGIVVVSQIVTDKNNITSEWGNYIAVLADDGEVMYYCHLEQRLVEVGDKVAAGNSIGIEGSTGKSTGPHCHFEVRINNKQTDPSVYLGISNSVGEYTPSEEGSFNEFVNDMEQYRGTLQDNDAEEWSRQAREFCINNGIFEGSGRLPNGEPNYMWQDFITREQVAMLIYRLAQKAGRA